MATQCTPTQLPFHPFGRREVVARFDAGHLTSDGGALLLREADPTGLERARARDRGHALAGSSTLNRLELGEPKAHEKRWRYSKIVADGEALDRLLVKLFLESHGRAPETVWLDLDATDDPLHGAQEGRFFHGYYKSYCYLPLYIFSGEHLLCARLRPSNIDAAEGSVQELKRIVGRIRQRFPAVRIVVRGDSGFCRDEIMDWCERNGVDYVLGLARNERLVKRIGKALRKSRSRHVATGRASRRFRAFRYRTRDSWSRTRRVVAKAEWLRKGANPRFVVTSLSREVAGAQYLYEKFVLRARGHGKQNQGMPVGSVRRPHRHGDATRQPTAAALRLLRLRVDARVAAPGAARHALGKGAVRRSGSAG